MKRAIKYFLLIMMITSKTMAQTEMRGVNIQGGNSLIDLALFQSYNGLAAWKAEYGIVYTGTNISKWVDITGNGYNLIDPSTVGPAFTQSFGTNGFPAVYFNGSQRLINHSLGALMNNKAPWTIICLQQVQNSGGIETWAAGYTQAQAASGSFIGYRSAGSPVTTVGLFYGYDTNVATVSSSSSRTPSTNAWFYTVGVFNGTQPRAYYNKAASNLGVAGGTLTLDEFTLGGLTRTNGIFSAQIIGGVNQLYFFTNALTGAQITNFVTTLNATKTVF